MPSLIRLLSLAATLALTSAISISAINGNQFLSPFRGQNVTDVAGIITAKGPDGLWIRSPTPDGDARTSESIYVFGRAFASTLVVGDSVVVAGNVVEYRSSTDYIYLTQISTPILVNRSSTGNQVRALVIAKDTTSPPSEQFSKLDGGDVFAVPNNVSQVSVANPILSPELYGLDFWESLTGELVTVRKPTAVAKPSSYGDTWVVGDWKLSGGNGRGGLTMTDKDANPEAIIIGSPLDGTKNPANTKLGDTLSDITGVVTYAFGFYRILPTTAINITSSQTPLLPSATKLLSNGKCDGLTLGAYNIENLAPNSSHVGAIASHIVEYLKSPDVMFLQEVQDDNGPTNDAVVSANLTLSTLITAISGAGGPTYAFATVDPVDDQDGGQPGGNIRVAYLYQPSVVRLYKPSTGDSTTATSVLPGPVLTYNPGRIDPTNEAWTRSRKPLVAQWEVIAKSGNGAGSFFTVNVHFGSKGGGSSIHGDARPPVNGGVADRLAQATLTANFIQSILAVDSNAHIITAGDFNEFTFVQPLTTLTSISKSQDLDAVTGVKEMERYTYLFDMSSQQLDHMFVSKSIASKKAQYEHVHINSWVEAASQISDHDPSVAKLDVCA